MCMFGCKIGKTKHGKWIKRRKSECKCFWGVWRGNIIKKKNKTFVCCLENDAGSKMNGKWIIGKWLKKKARSITSKSVKEAKGKRLFRVEEKGNNWKNHDAAAADD